MTGMALLVVLFMIARRFGWKGQAIALVLFGLGQPVRERIWFGKFIPALAFEPGVVPILSRGRHPDRKRVDCHARHACDRPAGRKIHGRECLNEL